MRKTKLHNVHLHIAKNEGESWDIIWQWSWFIKELWVKEYLKETKDALKGLFPLLSRWNVKSILDASCGLGIKTLFFAKMGYEVEGSDACQTAIKYAKEYAKSMGTKIRFFVSKFEELPENALRKYDCIFSDYFDELPSKKILLKSAKGIYQVLKPKGIFVFSSPPPEKDKSSLQHIIEKVWNKRNKFIVYSPFVKGDTKVTYIEMAEKKLDGICEHRIYLVERNRRIDVYKASIMNPRLKWTFYDFKYILQTAGFSEIKDYNKSKDEVFLVATKL